MKPATAAVHAGDISEADVRQELDARANRYEVVSRLADDLAHEIKNPLNAIVVNLEVLRRKIDTGAKQVALERAHVIDEEVARVHQLVDQLLQLVRPGRSDGRVLELAEVLEDLRPLLEMQAKAARVVLTLELAPDVFVQAPADTVKFAVLNLVTALYTEGGQLEQIRLVLTEQPGKAELRIESTPPALHGGSEFVQASRTLIEAVGGTMDTAELSGSEIGSTAVLRIPTCRSFV